MAIQNFTGALQQVLTNYGLGSRWNLGVCKYVAPPNSLGSPASTEKDRTITFLDANSLSGLNLSVFPALSELITFVESALTKQESDRAGKTKILNENILIENNIITYQLPKGGEIVRTWGNKATRFGLNVLICGDNYTDKIKKVAQFTSFISDLEGGTFYHPLFGTFENAHVVKIETIESSKVFNGSILNLEFISSNVFSVSNAPDQPLSQKLLDYVQEIIGLLQTLSTLSNTETQLKTSLQPLLAVLGTSNNTNLTTTSAGELIGLSEDVTFTSSLINPESAVSGVKIPEVTRNLELNATIKELNLFNIPLDFDLNYNTNLVMEQLFLYSNVTNGDWGNGYVTLSTSSSVEYLTDVFSIESVSETVNADGNLIITTRTVESVNDSGVYTVLVQTTVNEPVTNVENLNYTKSLIDQIIIYLSSLSKSSPNNYLDCVDLIANLESMYGTVALETNNQHTVKSNESILTLAITYDTTPTDILNKNPQLIASKPLIANMEILI